MAPTTLAYSSNQLHRVWSHHQTGISRLCYSLNGTHLYTTGADGHLRSYLTSPSTLNTEPIFLSSSETDEFVSVAASQSHVVLGGTEGSVLVLDKKNGEQYKKIVIGNNVLPVRDVSLRKSGNWLAVAADDLIVHVLDYENLSNPEIKLEGHKRSIREVSWSPDGKYLTSSSCDGTIRVWKCASQLGDENDIECVKIVENVIPPLRPEDEFSTKPVWHPRGSFFCVGDENGDIVQISSLTWSSIGSFVVSQERTGSNKYISSIAFSPNGNFLASGSADGSVVLWDTVTRSALIKTSASSSITSPKFATSIAFSPISNAISYVGNDGFLVRWMDPIPSIFGHPVDDPPKVKAIVEMDGMDDVGMNDLELDADFLDDDLGLLDLEKEEAVARRNRVNYTPDDGVRGDGDWDDGVVTAVRGKKKSLRPIQPGATPWENGRRYLAFNLLGVVTAVQGTTDEEGQSTNQIISVDFHDQNSENRHPYHFPDPNRYFLASLGNAGVAFASTSKVTWEPYDTSKEKWTSTLPDGEEVVALAVGGAGTEGVGVYGRSLQGQTVIVVATSEGIIRWFSEGGLRLEVWDVGERIVGVAAGEEFTMVLVERNGSVDYILRDNDTLEYVQGGVLPLLNESRIKWFGFTSKGIPAVYTSRNRVSILKHHRRPNQARWTPVLDTSTLSKDSNQRTYWVVGLRETQLMCVVLMGTTNPSAGNKIPPIIDFDLKIPLDSREDETEDLDERTLRRSIIASSERDGIVEGDEDAEITITREELDIDKSILQCIMTACRATSFMRAFDLCKLLHSTKTLQGAQKIAANVNNPELEDAIQILIDAREGITEEEYRRKRESKWGRLEDTRVYVKASAPEYLGGGVKRDWNGNELDRPFAEPMRKTNASAIFSGRPPAKREDEELDVTNESSPLAFEDSTYDTDDVDDRLEEPVRKKSRFGTIEESQKSSNFNPFAKKPEQPKPKPQLVPSTPFATTKTEKKKRPEKIQKSDSFFDRVDKKTGQGKKTKGSKDSNQKTLDGLFVSKQKKESVRSASKKKSISKSNEDLDNIPEDEDAMMMDTEPGDEANDRSDLIEENDETQLVEDESQTQTQTQDAQTPDMRFNSMFKLPTLEPLKVTQRHTTQGSEKENTVEENY